ncbi:hypothetical protein PV11_07215 [Exophiala sideris]|uniref:Secreted protein n=1 Tax=Exophiala sideris TaxID=1016849 RepID=A0A0D1Y9P0_9EURO|nr:hypothetical protein PV11_07215 [Exophiala sideris]
MSIILPCILTLHLPCQEGTASRRGGESLNNAVQVQLSHVCSPLPLSLRSIEIDAHKTHLLGPETFSFCGTGETTFDKRRLRWCTGRRCILWCDQILSHCWIVPP